jgi:hypothetical protein
MSQPTWLPSDYKGVSSIYSRDTRDKGMIHVPGRTDFIRLLSLKLKNYLGNFS